METIDWTKFTRKIYIDASIQRVYECWACPEELETWFLRTARYKDPNGRLRNPTEYAQKGDHFIWEWHHWNGKEEGTVLEANGRDRIAFTFGDSQVTVSLIADSDMCLVELTQDGIPVDEESKLNIYFGCGTGWTFWMANLKAYIEHFILLHDLEPDMTGKQDGMEFVNI